jgi:hypothetical protein
MGQLHPRRPPDVAPVPQGPGGHRPRRRADQGWNDQLLRRRRGVHAPAGYRPTSDRFFGIATTNGANVITPGSVDVFASGSVNICAGNNTYVAVEISFSI